ncbi:sulfatase family protein [Paenibacillus cremeus]|uniref:Sulfatase-like hydrolase/transferase n=1 Tax=Paenibacillus cremeus TaxID=2163881 RepID=A0A559KGQ8_9BACL|nr:sulfatase-like hydrolase/transferase [Paenibacillus cremeus]TVY11315.1 sulfatase-like hydrolase/transferase [Paenibacillus cremeus]
MAGTKNIILLMTDQLRLDYVSFHGKGKLHTPNIDRIAEGVGFTRCVSVNPICTPARCALLTGKYTHQIGMLSMSGDLSLQHPTYAQALQKAGYYTAGIGKFHWLQGWPFSTKRGQGHDLVGLKEEIRRYGFDTVWEVAGKQLAQKNYCDYCHYLADKGLLEHYRDFVQAYGKNEKMAEKQQFIGKPSPLPEEDYVDIVIGDHIVKQIESRPADRPFFIFGSFVSPHPPYDPPQSYLDRVAYEETDDFIPDGPQMLSHEAKQRLYSLRQAYKAMILLIDDQIGRILAKLEEEQLLDDTVILFTSDHGEMMGDHMRVAKQLPYWQSATVPTAIRHPDYLQGQVTDTPVELIDLTATILDIAGLDPKQALSKAWPAYHSVVPARSLLPIMTGEQERIRPYAFSESDGPGGRWQMVQNEACKYVRYLNYEWSEGGEGSGPVELFFDLVTDPQEETNRIGDPDYAAEIARCRSYREYILDTTPPAQQRWAPVLDPTQTL